MTDVGTVPEPWDESNFEPVTADIVRWAEQAPERVAVVCNGAERTYGDLLARAGEIAERLTAEGAGRGTRVAVCMARSTELVASLLGVMLCGAAYVPLDPLFPEERIKTVLRDAEVLLFLTDGSVALPEGRSLLVGDIAGGARSLPPWTAMGVEEPAYMIYTSGSTGTPKGVVIGHGGLRSMVWAVRQRPGWTADDAVLAITTMTFDLSVTDVFATLATGARLVLANNEEARNPAMVKRLAREHRATVMQATPGFWLAMIDEGWTTRGTGDAPLRVVCGGESMSRDLADMLLERADTVWNGYGPTECTVWASFTRVRPGSEPPPVDDVLPNCVFHMLNDALEPVAAGEIGELVLGGRGVGLGYWRRPELTAAKFVANPFGPGRLYRTGDLAQVAEDGRLRLLGRADQQVKVRGFRVELGEIEHVLAQHAAVREAVVLQHALPGAPAGVSLPLVAYLDVGAGWSGDVAALVEQLRESLLRTLPEYMVPARMVPVRGLPRLFNGKVDRRALPALAETTEAMPYLAPRTFVERQVAHIWQTTLEIPKIGVETSYFALGVDSLAALRLVTRVNRTFATSLGLANLLTAKTIADLAALIEAQHAPSVEQALVPLRVEGSRTPLFLVHGVGGNILNFVGLAGRLPADQPVYALQAQALLTGQPALLRIEDMAAHYIAEVRTVQRHGPYRLLGYSFGGTVVSEMAAQLRAAGEEVSLVAMLDAHTRAYERDYGAHLANGNAVDQLAGNIATLRPWAKVEYVLGKVGTRGVRGLVYAAHALGLRRLPSLLKVAWDVNLVALHRYTPRHGLGRMVLFRAKEAFAAGPRDLGWAPHFSDGIEVHEIESDHERLFAEPALSRLSAALSAVLETTA